MIIARSFLLCLIVGITAASSPARSQPMMEGGAMPDPRQMSGQTRPQEGDAAGTVTIRAVQGKFRVDEFGNRVSDFPKNGQVSLVGYDASGKVVNEVKPWDKEGRAVFSGLDTSGATVYYALANFERVNDKGEKVVDRLISVPIVPPPQVGLRLMLAGLANGSAEPPADDLARNDEFVPGRAPSANEVIVRIRGNAETPTVKLYRVGEDAAVNQAAAQPRVSIVNSAAKFLSAVADAKAAKGTLQVRLIEDQGNGPVSGGEVRIEASPRESLKIPAKNCPPFSAACGVTDERGAYSAVLPPGNYKVFIDAKQAKASGDVTLGESGGQTASFVVGWAESDALEAAFTQPAGPNDILYAEVMSGGKRILSPPFQLTPQLGAVVGILVWSEPVFSFHGGTNIDDERLWFQLQLTMYNPTAQPMNPPVGKDGFEIPLPHGFVSASIDEAMAQKVLVKKDQGVSWKGSLAPGEHEFIVTFALDVLAGKVRMEFPLPRGAYDSRLVMENLPGVKIAPEGDVKGAPWTGQDGRKYIAFSGINIREPRSIVMNISGLPEHPAWQVWTNRLAAGAVIVALTSILIGLMIWHFSRNRAASSVKEDLLAKLTALELSKQRGKISDADYEAQKNALKTTLLTFYRDEAAS